MSPNLHSLHWLLIRRRVTVKIVLLVWKCVHGAVPVYLQELLVFRLKTSEGAYGYMHLLDVFSYRG